MKIKFTKMHGCGNDYVYIDCSENTVENPAKLSTVLSDRRYGIGGDGIILICPSEVADAKMRIFNKDGSEGRMCGNGIRCVGKYLYDSGAVKSNNINIETLSGIKNISILENTPREAAVRVNMGKAIFEPKSIPVIADGDEVINRPITVNDVTYNITCVSVGNPHCVMFYDEIYSLNVKDIGSRLASNMIFPEGINVEFIKVEDEKNIHLRVWERGSGETLACGTGSCAGVSAAVAGELCPKNTDIAVHLRGGKLIVNYTDEAVYMTGNAVKVFEGEIEV